MNNQSDLALSGLKKIYGSTVAVEHITLRVKQGELVAFLGPSGCGKTTTLRMIAGLTTPSEGNVLINGATVTDKPAHQRNIGMLFQGYALFPHMTIAENVAFGLKMKKVNGAIRDKKVKEALELVQLAHVADRKPSALSGGQQQRIALARALVIEPSLLLLDEPLGALDKELRESMQVEIRHLQQRLGITTVLVTHDQEEALTMADQIVVMNNGRVEQVGTPEEIYSRPANSFVANFIGASNFLKGKTTSNNTNAGFVELEGGGQIYHQGNTERSGALTFIVRPEAVVIRPKGTQEETDNWTNAVIEDVIYRGQVTHIKMRRNNGQPFLAYLPNRTGGKMEDDLQPGNTITASWHTEGAHLLPDA
ncbi:ABC transporter ATP-binding protein (plasmid) [Pantoea sp. C3]|uniref:ABC transporter ATP-binding protein n=1 Tax=Pantoea phytostimulans TaxID=2769024 RepID=UPI0038F6557F